MKVGDMVRVIPGLEERQGIEAGRKRKIKEMKSNFVLLEGEAKGGFQTWYKTDEVIKKPNFFERIIESFGSTNNEIKRVWWGGVEYTVLRMSECSRGWTVTCGYTSMGFHHDALNLIKKYESRMKGKKYEITKDYFILTGLICGECCGRNFNKDGERIEIKLHR